MNIVFHHYEDEIAAYAEAKIRGFMVLGVNINGDIYEIWIYRKDRFELELNNSLEDIGAYYLNKNAVILSGDVDKDSVERYIRTIRDPQQFFRQAAV